MKFGSLFCGAGGLDLGLLEAGLEPGFAADSCEAAVESWAANVKTGTTHCVDLEDEQPLDLLESEFDDSPNWGLVGGPPCQGFSRARTNGPSGKDPRIRFPMVFVRHFLRLRETSRVTWMLMENVDALSAPRHKKILQELKDALKEEGLGCQVFKLQAADYGVPQLRERTFLFSAEPDVVSYFRVPQAIYSEKYRTVRDAIGGLPEPAFNTSGRQVVVGDFHRNHVTSRPQSSRFADRDFNRWRSFRRLSWDDPSPTVAYGNREIHVHPSGHRRLSIYEALRLQGFPKEAQLYGSFSAQVQQVSNAVPPPMARAVGWEIRRAFGEEIDL